ncbi:MAG: TIGR03790 family protein [Nitrosomonas sp.]|uniref:TIGR03790 family protein n=1 Tax=Nitrosomonas sp. TaxID=42353 RepID=UPI0032EB6BA1
MLTQICAKRIKRFPVILALILFSAFPVTLAAEALKHISLTRTGLMPEDIAIIINDSDPLSQQIGSYYQRARQIPEANVIHLRFPAGRSTMASTEFAQLKAEIDRLTPEHVQAFAVAWTAPYRVECMSLTSALAFGFDKKYCADKCEPTAPSPYFNALGSYPFDDYKMRPAMMLAGTSFTQVKDLIDRGIASDHTFPKGQAYLLNTSDKARSTRSVIFAETAKEFSGIFPVQILEADFISDRKDVLFYFTGLTHVSSLDTLEFIPGALADHLTSAGGMLTDSSQMSSLRWLEAGATASYGTVIEPCSFPQKFPSPVVAMFHYALGASALEAYWKSVAWPGQGVFIGEPLAKPFAPLLREMSSDRFELKIFSPRAGRLKIEKSHSAAGPFKLASRPQTIRRGENRFLLKFNEKTDGYLKLHWN